MMRNKKLSLFFIIIILLIAPNVGIGAEDGVVLLEPLPLPSGARGTPTSGSLPQYLSLAFPIAIGLAATLAIVMIALGGVEYIFSMVPGKKEEGKKRITEAILGLVLALAAYLILHTINPDLVKLRFDLPSTTPAPRPLSAEEMETGTDFGAGLQGGHRFDDSVGGYGED